MNQLQLGEELGSGAYGTVQRVVHKPTNVAMAMKVSLFRHVRHLYPTNFDSIHRKSAWNSTIPS